MENYLRTHPGIRWTIILLLLLGITLEGLFLSGQVGSGATGNPPDSGGLPTVTVELPCEVLVAVNLREGPATSFERKATLDVGTPLTALGRNSDVPWLLVRTGDNLEGWVSSFDTQGEPLVQCEGNLQSLPETGPATSGLSTVAEAQATATAEPTIAVAPTLTPAPDVRLREGNGPDLHAARRTFEIAIDGSLSEWGSTSAINVGNAVFGRDSWEGSADLSGVVRAAWDDEFLYIAAQVDDEAIVQESREDRLVRGDALELFWDGNLAGDFDTDVYSSDDSQMVFSPGNFAEKGPSAWVYRAPMNPAEFRAQISVASRRTERGYALEVRLPWPGLGVDPSEVPIFGYAIALSDDDSTGSGEQETQVSMTNDRPYEHPARWSNFILDP